MKVIDEGSILLGNAERRTQNAERRTQNAERQTPDAERLAAVKRGPATGNGQPAVKNA
jgi:hypothetical protein